MRYIKCTVQEDDEYGGFGLVPTMFGNWTNYAPSLFSAHDVLEHGSQETGGFDEEIAAHGGYLFVRNFGRVYPNLWRSVASTLGGGLSRQYQESSCEVRTPRKFSGLTIEELRRLDTFAAEYREEMIKDWADEVNLDMEDDEDLVPCPFEDEEVWTNLVGWLKYGYARAKRRFKNDCDSAWALFESLDKLLTKNAALWANAEGATFTICLDYDNGYASLSGGFYAD